MVDLLHVSVHKSWKMVFGDLTCDMRNGGGPGGVAAILMSQAKL